MLQTKQKNVLFILHRAFFFCYFVFINTDGPV